MESLSGLDIVCFSNDWGGDPLSKMHLMRRAAKRNRVLWVNSLGNRGPKATGRDLARLGRKLLAAFSGLQEVEPNLFVFSPLALPPSSDWAATVNAPLLGAQVRGAMRRLSMHRPVVVSYLPSAAPAVDKLGARLNVYHCVDDFAAFEGAGPRIARLERELMAKSDVVVCSTEVLAQAKSAVHPRVELVRHGVDFEHFVRATGNLEAHPLVARLPRPIIGFVGLVAEWVDQELLAAVARRLPHGSVVVIGRSTVDVSRLCSVPNIHILGHQPYRELPALMKGFDVAVVPFIDGSVARAASPLKAREYAAAGLPIVSTPIPEVQRLPGARVARGEEAFISAVEQTLSETPGPRRERAEAMRGESWEARWEELAGIIARLLRESDEGDALRSA